MIYRFTDPKGRVLNVRAEPSAEAEVVCQLQPGTEFEAEDQGDWLAREDGFVMASLCEVVETDPLQAMSIKELRELAKESGIKLKSGANKAEIIEALLNG